jgi:hypothetical protein
MQTLTFPLIQKLADERLRLYELAANQYLTPEQRARIAEINDRLPGMWDQYRRELASQHGPAVRISGVEKLRQSVAAEWREDEKERQAA